MQEHRPKILHRRAFWDEFKRCLRRYPSELQIASPFIGNLPPGYDTIVRFSEGLRKRECNLVIVTRPPQQGAPPPSRGGSGTLYAYEAEQLEKMGVELLIHRQLHSKVYQFRFPQGDRAAFVGSANFTLGGLERNEETVAMFRHVQDNDGVERELARLKGFGTYPYHHWKASPGS